MIVPPSETRVERIENGRAIIRIGVREMQDSEGSRYGGYGYHTATTNPKDLWTRKERSQFKDFLRLKRKGLYTKLMQKYGTTDECVMERLLNVQMLADPRLTVKTRRGIVRTTVESQSQFAWQGAGPHGGKEKK
jgi:hypothetical protein